MFRKTVSRVVPHARETMFDLIADVERYPQFVPMWQAARVIRHGDSFYETEQVLRVNLARYRFVSKTFVEPPERIVITSEDKLFRAMTFEWTLEEVEPGSSSRITLEVKVDMSSGLLEDLVMTVAKRSADNLIKAFEDRANHIDRPNRMAG